jgi:hypothetical protein
MTPSRELAAHWLGFERRVKIAFVVERERVVIPRIFLGGRNW